MDRIEMVRSDFGKIELLKFALVFQELVYLCR